MALPLMQWLRSLCMGVRLQQNGEGGMSDGDAEEREARSERENNRKDSEPSE